MIPIPRMRTHRKEIPSGMRQDPVFARFSVPKLIYGESALWHPLKPEDWKGFTHAVCHKYAESNKELVGTTQDLDKPWDDLRSK